MSTRNTFGSPKGGVTNNTRRPSSSVSQDRGGATIKSTGIAFVASSTFTDSNNGFAAVQIGMRVKVRGSALNSRAWEVIGKASDGQIAVRPQQVQAEAAGAAVTITIEG
jgi:hypothetical protein